MFDTTGLPKKAAVLSCVGMLLGACATNSGTADMDSASMNSDERELARYAGKSYVEDYAVQGGLAGALGGAAIGCILFEVIGSDCAKGAIALGVAGGVGGAVWGAEQGRQTEKLAERQLRAEEAQAIAESELAAARESKAAATEVVNQQKARLSSLRNNLVNGRASQTEAQEALKEARRAEALIGGSRDKLSDSLKDVKDRIDLEQRKGNDTTKLEETHRDMQQEEYALNSQLSALQAEIELTEATATT